MAAVPTQLSILTLNIWGVPYLSSDRKLRIPAIAEELASGKYDIVSLQEVWSEYDNQLIQNKAKNVLPYAHYFYSGVMGAGLLVLSKFPIVSSLFHAWPINGYFHRIQHADWFGGKGIGLCRIRFDRETYINVYNAHLHAEYNVKQDDYKAHRILQAFDAAQFIEATRSDCSLQILTGDLNVKPDDLSYKILLYISAMIDSCSLNSVETYRNKHNYYKNKKHKMEYGERIDHVWLRVSPTSSSNMKITVLNYALPLPHDIPNQSISYSDHEAVLVQLQLLKLNDTEKERDHRILPKILTKKKILAAGREYEQQDKIDILLEAISLCDQHMKQLHIDRFVYFTAAFVLISIFFLMPHFNYKILQILLNMLMIGGVIFCIFMGLIWNFIERHATLSGRNSMAIKMNGFIIND